MTHYHYSARRKGAKTTAMKAVVVVPIIIMSIFLISSIHSAAAQLSPTAQNIISIVQSGCKEDTGLVQQQDLNNCVFAKYESPTLVVLSADELITDLNLGGYIENGWIWQAVDGFKVEGGYNIDSIVLTGEGTELNPHEYIIVMSK